MKKILTIGSLLFLFAVNAQKKKNGTIYIDHPQIETVEKFNAAYVSGDVETLKGMVADNFKWYTTNVRTPRTLEDLLGRSSYLSRNIANFSIKHWGGSYPDVLEYKKDEIVDVKTYEYLTGHDINTGVDLTMPRYATFRIDKNSKIIALWVNDDQVLWKKAYDAYGTSKNGVVYKDHPFISNIRLMIAGIREMDVEKVRAYFNENARIYDVMNRGEFDFKSLDEEMNDMKAAFELFEIMRIQEIGFPDAIAYEGGQVVILSWWKVRVKNRKSGKVATVMQHLQHTVNKDGEIVREDYYYNPAQFPN